MLINLSILVKSLMIILTAVLGAASLVAAQEITLPDDRTRGLDFSPDSSLIAVARYTGAIEIYDRDGSLVRTLTSPQLERFISLDWSENGDLIASTSLSGKIYIWETSNWTLRYTFESPLGNYLFYLAWNEDNSQIATISQLDYQLLVWDLLTEDIIFQSGGIQSGLTWHNNLLADGGGNGIGVTNTDVWEFQGLIGLQDQDVVSIDWNPPGTAIASGSMDGTVYIWDATGESYFPEYPAHTFYGHTMPVTDVSWSPDGALIASSSYDGTVRIWHAESGQALKTIEAGAIVLTVQWSPDGEVLAYSGDVLGLGGAVITQTTQQLLSTPALSASSPAPTQVSTPPG